MGYEGKELVRRVFEVINSGELERADEVIHPDHVDHSFGMDFKGPDGFRQLIGMFRAAFPDLHVTVEELIAEGDVVAWRSVARGTHGGEFMGIPATGRQVSFTSVDFGRTRDGLAVEHWPSPDALGLLQQLGAVPELAQS